MDAALPRAALALSRPPRNAQETSRLACHCTSFTRRSVRCSKRNVERNLIALFVGPLRRGRIFRRILRYDCFVPRVHARRPAPALAGRQATPRKRRANVPPCFHLLTERRRMPYCGFCCAHALRQRVFPVPAKASTLSTSPTSNSVLTTASCSGVSVDKSILS